MSIDMRFHHIGIATENIEITKEYCKSIFNIESISESVFDEKQDALLCMIQLTDGSIGMEVAGYGMSGGSSIGLSRFGGIIEEGVGGGCGIELIEGNAVKNFLKRRQYLYHIGYEVCNIDDAISNLVSAGGYLVKPPTEAIFFNNRLAAFVMTQLGLIELLESQIPPLISI